MCEVLCITFSNSIIRKQIHYTVALNLTPLLPSGTTRRGFLNIGIHRNGYF